MRARQWLIVSSFSLVIASCGSEHTDEPERIDSSAAPVTNDSGSTSGSDAGSSDSDASTSSNDAGRDAGTSTLMDAGSDAGQDAGAVDAGAMDATLSDSAVDASSSDAEAGAGQGAIAMLGAPCTTALDKACTGNNAADKLVCLDGKWAHNGSCDTDARCETTRGPSQGLCVGIATGCAGKTPGATVCDGLTVKTCGPDLIDLKLTTTCSTNAHCEEGMPASCKCDTGYTAGTGGTCTNANDCASSPCGTGNTCTDALNDYTCTCNTNNFWQRDPKTCVSKFDRVSAGSNRTCAIRRDRTVACWGTGMDGDNSVPQQIAGLTNVTQISVGTDHACARREDGTVLCWGQNDEGQLGNGNNTDSLRTPVSILNLNGVTQVSAGDRFTCAVRGADLFNNARVFCWGRNEFGQLGINNTQARVNRPTQVNGNTAFDAVAAGTDHVCARRGSNGTSCWGRNNHGQLGLGTITERVNSPTNVTGSLGSVSDIVAGGDFTCARKNNQVHCWGVPLGGADGAVDLSTPPATPIADLTEVAQLSAGAASAHVCVRRSNNAVLCWGSDADGQLGNGDGGASATPAAISGTVTAFRDVSVGARHTCAVRNGTDGDILCWGEGSAGELGNGTTTDTNVPATAVTH
jgi:hypothetical protein